MKKLRFILCASFFMFSLVTLSACGKKSAEEPVEEQQQSQSPEASGFDVIGGAYADYDDYQQPQGNIVYDSNSYFDNSQNANDKRIEEDLEWHPDCDGEECIYGNQYYEMSDEDFDEKLATLDPSYSGLVFRGLMRKRLFDIYASNAKYDTNYVMSPYSIYNSMSVIMYGTIDSSDVKYKADMARWFEYVDGNPSLPDYVNAGMQLYDEKFRSQQAFTFTNLIGTTSTFRSSITNSQGLSIFNTYNTEFEENIGDTYGSLNAHIQGINTYILFNGDYDIENTYCASIGAFNCNYANESEYYVTGEQFNNSSCIYSYFNEELKYVNTASAEYCIKPFDDECYSLLFIKPKSDIESYVNNYFSDEYWNIINTEDTKMLSLYIPVFRTLSETPLDSYVKSNGMSSLYDDKSNTGVLRAFLTGGGSSVDTITHASYFALNGRGARSYNNILDQRTIDQVEAEEGSTEFKLDKPFIYVIFDNDSGIPVMIVNVVTME